MTGTMDFLSRTGSSTMALTFLTMKSLIWFALFRDVLVPVDDDRVVANPELSDDVRSRR